MKEYAAFGGLGWWHWRLYSGVMLLHRFYWRLNDFFYQLSLCFGFNGTVTGCVRAAACFLPSRFRCCQRCLNLSGLFLNRFFCRKFNQTVIIDGHAGGNFDQTFIINIVVCRLFSGPCKDRLSFFGLIGFGLLQRVFLLSSHP